MQPPARARLCSALVLLACQAREEPVKKPRPPDLGPLVSAYAAPTAALDAESASTLLASVHDTAGVLNRAGIDRTLLDTLESALAAHLGELSAAQAVENVRAVRQAELQGDGYLRVTRICNGWGPEPVPDKDENGYIVLTAGFTDAGFDPVVWGAFFDCRYRIGDQLIELGGVEENGYGTFSGYLGEGVPFERTGRTRMLFEFEVLATLDGEPYTVASDFAVDPSALGFEFRVFSGAGYLIANASTELLGVRATNGDFACSEATLSCSNGSETVQF